jgi:hypothetical protein
MPANGWWVVAHQSPNRLGLIDLNGTIPPRPTSGGTGSPNTDR